jgi:large subunit ribosomal protein L10
MKGGMPMITRADKAQEIAFLSERFGRAKAAFLVDFKGMSVEQVTSLRKKLVPVESEMKVVRNTLAIRALKDHPNSEAAIAAGFVGNNAIVFAYGDASASAKALTDFAKDVEVLQLKVGVIEGQKLDSTGIKALGSLPSKEVLRSMLLGTLQAPMSKFVGTLNAVPSGLVRVLAAHKDKQEQSA